MLSVVTVTTIKDKYWLLNGTGNIAVTVLQLALQPGHSQLHCRTREPATCRNVSLNEQQALPVLRYAQPLFSCQTR